MALTMIAMTTAYLVRTEAAARSNQIEAERAAYLARGGVQAAIYALLRPAATPAAGESGLIQRFRAGQRWLQFDFQEGSCRVEVAPENAKLNVNVASIDQLAALFILVGWPAAESQELAAAIADWRSPRASSVASAFDLYYAALDQPYAASHAPFRELDELLAVKGMSRDLFFDQIGMSPAGVRKRTPPLADLLTTEPNYGGVNLVYAANEVLRVLPGWDESLASSVVEARARAGAGTLAELVPGLSAAMSLSEVTVSPGFDYTLTATAQARDSAVRRTVRARIRLDSTAPMGFRVLGWWSDWPWSPEAPGGEGAEGLRAGGISL